MNYEYIENDILKIYFDTRQELNDFIINCDMLHHTFNLDSKYWDKHPDIREQLSNYEPVPFGSLDVTNIGYTKVGSFERPIDDIFNSKYDVLVDNPTKIWYFSGSDALGFFAVAKGRFTNNDGDSIYFAKSGPVGLLLGGPDDELYDGVLCRFGSTDSSSGGLFATQVVGKERSTTTFEQGAGVVRFCYF